MHNPAPAVDNLWAALCTTNYIEVVRRFRLRRPPRGSRTVLSGSSEPLAAKGRRSRPARTIVFGPAGVTWLVGRIRMLSIGTVTKSPIKPEGPLELILPRALRPPRPRADAGGCVSLGGSAAVTARHELYESARGATKPSPGVAARIHLAVTGASTPTPSPHSASRRACRAPQPSWRGCLRRPVGCTPCPTSAPTDADLTSSARSG